MNENFVLLPKSSQVDNLMEMFGDVKERTFARENFDHAMQLRNQKYP